MEQTTGIPPTNHLAEQAIRFVVIDRIITQGRSVFDYLHHPIAAYFAEQRAPSLLPAGTGTVTRRN